MRSGTAVGRRLSLLAVLELASMFIIGWASFGPFRAPPTSANVVAFALVAMHLVIGGGYWAAKHWQLRRGSTLPAGAHLLEPIRRVLLAALAIGAILIAISAATAPMSRWLASIPLWLLATGEHVNYFHWQLMYDNAADIRRLLRNGFVRPHLRADAFAARAVAPEAPAESARG